MTKEKLCSFNTITGVTFLQGSGCGPPVPPPPESTPAHRHPEQTEAKKRLDIPSVILKYEQKQGRENKTTAKTRGPAWGRNASAVMTTVCVNIWTTRSPAYRGPNPKGNPPG